MKRILFFLSVVALMAVSGSCSKRSTVSMSYNYAPQVLNMELDGSVTMRVWAEGRNRADAIEQAHKDAINTVLFKGFTAEGVRASLSRPLVPEANAEIKYRYFFNQFFADRGPFTKFVSREDTRGGTNVRERSRTQVRYEVTVRVLRSELEQYLIEEGILEP
jgi:hypothetical protein